MRICIAASEFPPVFGGGIATFYGNLADLLSSAGHEVSVLTDVPAEPARFDDDALPYTVKRLSLRTGRPATGDDYRRALEAEGGAFDVIEAADYSGLGVHLPGLQPALAITCHGTVGQVDHHSGRTEPPRKNRLRSHHELLALLTADEVNCHSPANQEDWQRFLGRRPMFSRAPYLAGESRENSKLSEAIDSDLELFGVGRLNNWKGVLELAEAVDRVRATGLRVRLKWVGRDQDAPEEGIRSVLEHLRTSRPRFFHEAFEWQQSATPSEVRSAHLSCHAAVVPSRWDTFNFTAVEALDCSAPLIVSRGAGASYLCRPDENALVVDARSVDQLTDAIIRLRDPSLRQRIGRAGKRTVEEHFTADAIVADRLAVYESAIDRRRYRAKHRYGSVAGIAEAAKRNARIALGSRLRSLGRRLLGAGGRTPR
ncbi:MAG: glycosyltransferase family 1 protein [Acidobacteria bacterium]|nr:MAG: glycosyltransferase family 1 protein [Acidobacteriota bacterium]REK04367.1 MAG: glycosyltransferase family 1 protein [Acidobacteriota bacterium]